MIANKDNISLENAKIGDKVIVSGRWHEPFIATIENITPKGFFRVGGDLYNKDGFRRTSDRWDTKRIRLVPTEELEEVELKMKETAFVKAVIKKCHNLSTLTYEEAKVINDILLKKN